jgi:hypothetical protein
MSGLRLRVRQVPFVAPSVLGRLYTLNLATGVRTQESVVPPTGVGKILETSKCSDVTHPGPPYLNGGHLFVERLIVPAQQSANVKIRIPNANASSPNRPGFERVYEGAFQVGSEYGFTSLGNFEALLGPDHYSLVNPDDLSSLGNRAYNKLRPKVEVGSLAQSVFEARELPGMLKTTGQGFHAIWRDLVNGSLSRPPSRGGSPLRHEMERFSQYPKEVSNQFLNVQFGWKPFVREVNSMCDVVVNFDQHSERLRKQNDKWMNRTFTEDTVESDELVHSSTSTQNDCYPALSASIFIKPGSCWQTVRRKKMTRVWYKGVFKFYRPEFDYSREQVEHLRTVRQYMTLLGLDVTPTTLYKVTPWSWLVDWFVNAGDALQRVQDLATDAVASKYFYVMRHSLVEYEYRKVFTTRDGVTHDFTWNRTVEAKRRGESKHPFNFSLLPGNLSDSQLAVIAALGITRAS